MSCCDDITAVKTETFDWTWTFSDDFDLTGYTARFRIAESQGASVLMEIVQIATVNDSRTVVTTSTVRTVINVPDLVTLPNGNPVSDPWVGVFECDLISPIGEVTRLDYGDFVLEKGV